MATLMTLELHYPTNWAYEGEVDVLYCDGSSETSYGRLAQGQTMSRETYEGHRWAVREARITLTLTLTLALTLALALALPLTLTLTLTLAGGGAAAGPLCPLVAPPIPPPQMPD